ncbi:hypothetical protein BJ875DRAFT_473434 [Amylocarpus encephaloides]|uniref:Uncharacterized protein n=1 Tax=Amylocarpus encephaloides TaxID=45428 RepID=A0A9P8C1I7_9HELO|nr:hypothetical protein BJ875DRAFT_473434 [Amylocarpus encephaloides]
MSFPNVVFLTGQSRRPNVRSTWQVTPVCRSFLTEDLRPSRCAQAFDRLLYTHEPIQLYVNDLLLSLASLWKINLLEKVKMSAPAEVQAATLDKFIAGWKEFTPESWMATWSGDCTQKMLPFSLGVPARPRAEVIGILPSLMGILKNYQLDIYEIVHDAPRNKAVIYATSNADTPFGDFKWTNEYAVFLTFTEDGTQVGKFEEMVDTAFYQQFFPRFQQYMKEQGAAAH